VSERFSDRDYLAFQYGDAERLRIRHETHARFSENRGHYFDWLLKHLAVQPGLVLLDLGCGHGAQHPRLRQQQMHILGVDRSPGMLREACAQARRAGLDVRVCRGDATCIPLADGSVDRVMANHMLYHVPDPRAALAEMRRVLRDDGRVVIGTNAADSGRRLLDLHGAVAEQLGYTPTPAVYSAFNLGHLPLVQEVFPEAKLKLRSDAFVFPDVASALAYYASALVDHIDPLPADGSHREHLCQVMASEIQKILDTEGVFRVPKNAGCFVAEVRRGRPARRSAG
jgi:ubiquinone/menaquinone biosynthesis C-methylase UbiE